jgi:hypothetical protein
MELRPEERCEADITYKKIQEGTSRIGYDFEGRKYDLGPDVKDQPGIEEATIDCSRCPLKGVVFQAEGAPPWGAHNAIRNAAADVIEKSCEKFKPLKEKGLRLGSRNLSPRDFHPNLSS